MILPYWLLNGDELEELFLDAGDNNNYNQFSLLRNLITLNKQKHNSESDNPLDTEKIDFDSPLKFDVSEIYTCLRNLKLETYDYGNDLIAKYKTGDVTYENISQKYSDYFKEILERELKSLQKTGDYYPKYLITLDMDLESDYEGITKINVIGWLLNKE